MSFTNNFLKALEKKGVNVMNNAGGSKSPASSEKSPSDSGRNSYTSNFLSALQKQENMTISERAAARAQALQKKQQEYAGTPAGTSSGFTRSDNGLTTAGGYYSRPTLGSYSEKLYGNISALEPVLTEKRAALDTAQTSLAQAESELQTVQNYLNQARAVYDADPTEANANSYNQIVGAYNMAYDSYASAFKTYSTAYDAYKPYEDQLIDALAVYQLYSNQQQAAFNDWRGTIRDATTIQAEIATIDQQIANLEAAEAAAAEADRQPHLAEYPAWGGIKSWHVKLADHLLSEKTTSREMQQLIDMKELLQEELNWSQYYYYADFASASDFAKMSKYVPQERTERRALDIMLDNYSYDASGWEDPLYEYINGNEEAGAYISNAAANYYGPDNAIGGVFGKATESKTESQKMTEQEIATFNYLYATQGKSYAYAYYNYLLGDLNYRQRKADEEYWAAETAKNPVGSSVFSVITSPAKGLSYIGQLGDYIGDGEIDQNAAYNEFSYIPSSIRRQIVQRMENSGKWGKAGSFAYQTGMSMADFLWTSAITGGNQTAALTIMGSGAAADTTLAAKDRGLEDWQAFTLGTVAGLAEALTEKVSLDKLFDADLLADGTLKYILENAFAEGSEEVASSTVNLLADIIVSKDQSEWQQSINAYMEEGLTEGQAFARAMADQALSLGADFLGGFISGGAMGGGGAVIGSINTEKIGNELGNLQMNDEDIQSFIETGLESDPETASYKIAVELQGKIQKGQKLSNYDLSRLYQANVQAQPEAVWDSSTAPKNVSLLRLDDESGGEVSAEAMRRQAQTDYRAGKITEAEFDAIIDEVMHLEELEDGTSVKTLDNQADINTQTDNININVNGGTTYDSIHQQPGRPAAAQSAGGFDTQRADISDGVPIRDAGKGAGIQTGQMASSAGRQGTQTNSQAKAIIERQNTAGDLRQQGLISATSSLALGIESGTDTENLYVMPQEYYDAELLQAVQFARAETGLNVAFTVGNIEINRGSRTGKVRGVHTGQQIVVQSDNAKATAMQLVKHEVFHDKAMKDPGLTQRLKEEVRDRFTPQEFDAVMDRYIDELWPLYGPADETAWDEYESAWNIILEEMLADAYAGINAFGAHAEQFAETVSELTPAKTVDKQQKQDNGTEEPTGPPSDRYSFAGENANNADLDALARAKEMHAAGVADETIRQQTGWHTGMDGKWRWEIDDSGMEYSSRGDLGLRQRRPEYARYRELLDKANRHALELSDEALTPEEAAELQKLKNIWGGTFRKAGRITEDALPTELLSDYVKHDALFEAYPQLRKTRLRFADLPEDTRGEYDPEQDIIILSNKLRGKPQDTLIHEIQHVIQEVEGFAQGSSPEFWEQVQKGEQPVRANDRRVAEAERRIQEIMDSLPPFVAGQFELHRHLEKSDPDKAMELADALSEGPYGDEFSDFFLLTWDLDMAAGEDNYIRGAGDLYRNTAGEIEARDAASRRQLTVEQRRSAEPARADDRTVFVEDIDGAAYAELDAQYGPQLQSAAEFDQDTISGNIRQVAQMEPVTSISGQEFAKGEVDLITQVETFFNQRGNRAYSPELGEVILDRRGIKSDIAHGIGRKKAAAFAAVPDVIEHGLVVDYQKDWKARGYDTAVVAAPITIGTEDHIAAVILTRSNQTNRFYVHEVLTTKNGAMPFKTGTREGYPGGDAPSVFSILDKIRSVKNQGIAIEKFSVDDMDSHGHSLTPEQQKFYARSQARDSSGRLLVLYHQTDGDFTIFDTRHPGAGSRDSDTPFGIFLKQTAGDIGLTGKRQMALYANITNPLRASNREDLTRQLREISGNYATISNKHKQLDTEYHEKFEQAKKAWRDYIVEWRAANPGANRSALNDDPKFNELFDAEDAVVDEWTAAADLLSTQAKEAITEDLRKAGYDGVFMENDVGSWGRRTDAIIALDPQQVKNISNKTPTSDPDIRYSVDEETGDLRESMTTKEREILRGVETRLLRNIGGALSVTKFGGRSYLKSVIRGLSDTYLESGTIEQQAMDDLFEQAYRQGIVVDRELHDQYEEVRKYLHTVSLTLDPRDRSDIADYPDFVKRMRGRMRIVNEGGLPVDSAWHELNDMAPELFPDSIAHPADQLVRMTEVLDSLRIAEKSLSDYYGPMASTYKKDAKAEFERAVWESIGELRQIRRFEQERQQKLQEAEPAPTTPEEAMEAWAKLKTARKTYEKAMAKNLLTTEDEIAVGELLKGKLLPEHLDKDNLNVKGILAVYEAKQEYEHLTKLLAEYRRKVKADIRAEADTYLETANTWKDKDIGLLYSREIMQRNVEDIVPDKKLAKRINERYFESVRDAEAAAVKMKEEYREAVRKLSLSRNVKKGNLVSEAHAVQLYGEAMDNIRILEKARGRLKHRDGKSLEEWRGVVYKLWQENPGLDKAKIESAVAEMRQIYDELFRKMNEVRVRWGYEPVNYRQGYFPHFQPGNGDGIMAQFGRVLGIDTQVVALPTTINGLTHTFKPGIQWFGNAQERLGFNTAYDAVEGFDRYIEGVASVICQTENIQRLRALASQIRYRTSDEGIRKQVDAIYSNAALTEEQKNDAISGIYEKGRYTLSNFVVEVDEYTNLLANKKSKLDRTVEALIGRKFYTAMKWLESRVGANMIAGNVTSALTNFIPLTQASAQLSKKAMLKGMWDTLASYKTDDGIIDRSAFLTNRRGSDPLVKVWSAKVSEVLGKPMELIDSFTSGSIVRAAYYQNLKQGLSESEAMHQADIFASRVMAERSKGGMPTLFESKNPFFKLFTQFQLEVNNQWSEVFKDIPRSQREKGLGALALVFLQYFLGAWLFNNLYEKWIGRRPAMDPIDIVLDAVKDFASDDVSATDALGNLANNVLEELPFSSALTLVGIETDGGRVPVSSGIPNIPTLVNAATNEDWAPEKRWKEAQDELNKLAYVIPPFGGNQVSKIWKGIKAYIEGGSYSVDSDGNDILQYPVYNDESGDFWGLVQAMLLGKSALPEAKEWVEDGFDSLSAKQTAIYQDMIDSGVSEREAYDLIDSLRSATETDEVSKKEAQIRILQDAAASDECKAIAFYGLLATDNERLIMDSLTDSGAMPGPAMDVLIQLRDAAALPSAEEKVAQADILVGSALTEIEKEIVIRSWLDDQEVNENGNLTSLGKFNLAMKQGITTEEYLRFRATGMEIDKLLEYTEAGFEADEAQELAQAIHDLDPLPGEERVSTLQKWRASVDFSDDVEDQLTALSAVMTDAQFLKVEIANNFGVSPDAYVTLQEIKSQYDADGNGTYKNAEIQAAVDGLPGYYTTEQKAVLWQLATGSTSARNNPYSRQVGQQVLDARAAAKEAAAQEQAETLTDSADDDSFSRALLDQLLGRG